MPYVKQPWTDNVTPVDSAHMTHIEDGIAAVETGRQGAISYGTTPPVSPVDGDLWCLPADATNGVMWLFRYRTASAAAYKWEFVGGPPAYAVVMADEAVSAINVWASAATLGPDFLVPRGGDYRAQFTARGVSPGAAAIVAMGIANVSVSTTPIGATSTDSLVAGGYASLAGQAALPGLALGQTVRAQYQTTVTNIAFGFRTLSVLPVRVG